MVKAIWNGVTLAQSQDTVMVEGNHYFPADSVDHRFLRPNSATTACPWKGTADYYDVVAEGAANPRAAWTYPNPKPAADAIRDRIAFWNGVTVG